MKKNGCKKTEQSRPNDKPSLFSGYFKTSCMCECLSVTCTGERRNFEAVLVLGKG